MLFSQRLSSTLQQSHDATAGLPVRLAGPRFTKGQRQSAKSISAKTPGFFRILQITNQDQSHSIATTKKTKNDEIKSHQLALVSLYYNSAIFRPTKTYSPTSSPPSRQAASGSQKIDSKSDRFERLPLSPNTVRQSSSQQSAAKKTGHCWLRPTACRRKKKNMLTLEYLSENTSGF